MLTFNWQMHFKNFWSRVAGYNRRFTNGNPVILRECVAELQAAGVVKSPPILVLHGGHQLEVPVAVGHYSPSFWIQNWLLELLSLS